MAAVSARATHLNRHPEPIRWDRPRIQDAKFLTIAFLNILTTYVWHKPNYNREKFAHYDWEKRRPAVIQLIAEERPSVLGLCELDLTQEKDLKKEMGEGGKLQGYQLVGFSSETARTIEETEKTHQDREWLLYGEFVALLVDTKRVEVKSAECHKLPKEPHQRYNRVLVQAHLVDKIAQTQFDVLVSHFDYETPESRKKSAEIELALINQLEEKGTPWVAIGDRNWGPETGEEESQPYADHPSVIDFRDDTALGCFGPAGTFIRKMPLTLDTVDVGYRSKKMTESACYYTRTGIYDKETGRLRPDDSKPVGCISDHLLFAGVVHFKKSENASV